MDVTIGQLIDSKYRIVRMLGQGGMGAVYEGENVRIHHRVAIKVLHAGIATNSDALERFEREAQAAGKIGSDHIVEVYDLGELANGSRYMVMEYLEGENLSMRIQNHGRMPAEAIAPVMMQLLEGLGAAHAAGIVHRDLKPDNIFLVRSKKTGGDFVKIVDFGVSKFNKLSGDSAMSMTRTGAVIGTPYYMSPEQAKGAKSTDHRSDLYSVGVVLYECATGQVPFQADTFNELMFKIVLETPPDPEVLVQGIDPRFAAIIKKAMAREADARFQTAGEFQQAIASWMGAVGGVMSGAFSQNPQTLPQPVSINTLGRTAPTPPNAAFSKTAGSLPNVGVSVATTHAPAAKSNKGGAIAAIAIAAVVLVVGGGVVTMKLVKGRGGASDTPVATSTVKPPDPPVAAVAPPTPTPTPTAALSAASAPSATASAPSAAASVAVTPPPTSTSRSGSSGSRGTPKPAASASSSAASASTAQQVKGRTIRTDL
jgi:serine/threonine-protein kinase